MSKLAFVFPGQGSQAVGMLAELASAYALVRETFDEASSGARHDLWTLSQQGPAELLNRTDLTQPALLAASVAVWRVWQSLGGRLPDLLAGHSLGEYSALVCAGSVSLAEAAGLVAERGRLMQEAVPQGVGAMAAVIGAEDALVAEVCAAVAGTEVVAPANYNSPGQIVIAGHAVAVDRAIAELGERGVRKVVKLAVSVPSHCMLMRDAADRLAERMDEINWHMPSIPVVQNVDGRVHDSIASIRAALVAQLWQPVRWTDCTLALRDLGASRVAECGPGKVLCGLIKRIDKSLESRALGMPEDLDSTLKEWNA